MRRPHPECVLAAACALVLTAGCARVLTGTPVSVFADPFQVAGLAATDGPSELRPEAPAPDRDVERTDGGRVDQIAAQAVSDIEDFWTANYSEAFDGEFHRVATLVSWDARRPVGVFCENQTALLVNAAYCYLDNAIGWDRGLLLPQLRKTYGDIAIDLVLAHEYGHAIAAHAGLTKPHGTPTLVAEQQADCLTGVYLRWVAQGDSPRFVLSTGDGLNTVLAAMLVLRDPPLHAGDEADQDKDDEHGSAFERISAFQFGFTDGAMACRNIDRAEIDRRRGDLPVELRRDETGELPVTEDTVRLVVSAMNTLFPLVDPPRVSVAGADPPCAGARPSAPVSYCPDTNVIAVDLRALQQMSVATEVDPVVTLSGDNTAYSVVVSRYMLAVQAQRGGLVLDDARAALRTACLTGVATARMSRGVVASEGQVFSLSAGDLDEATAGLLTNGLAASDVNGESVPAGFSRIDAFRAGVLGDDDRCLRRFP